MKTIINKKRGFTLMELLVVIALSMILLGLVMAPVIQSFNLTRRAEALVDAQDSARTSMTRITRDFSQAMFVYDNQAEMIPTPKYPYPAPTVHITLPTQNNGNIALYYAKIDMVLPKMVMHCNNPDHPVVQPRDFQREETISSNTYEYDLRPCPACAAAGEDPHIVEVKPKLPLEQSGKLVRYFLGLKNNKPTATRWNAKDINSISDNSVVLYRAEFDPKDDKLFEQDPNDKEKFAKNLQDPDFFYSQSTDGNGIPRWQNWARVAKPIGISRRQDLVNATFDNAGNLTSLQPTVTFRFTMVDNEALSGSYLNDAANDYPGAMPTNFRAKHGYWAWTAQSSIEVLRDDPNTNYPSPDVVYRTEIDPNNGHVIIKKYQYNNGTSDYDDMGAMFDITQYNLDGSYKIKPPELEMAFLIDPNKGAVNFALPASEPIGLNPADINKGFNADYAADMSSATRGGTLRPLYDPLNPDMFQQALIVPGTERVFGANFYNADADIAYDRVPLGLGDARANQYKIDYDSRYLEFASSPSTPLPELDSSGNAVPNIDVKYLMHFNKPGDIIRASYVTKSLVTVNLGIKLYDKIVGKANIVNVTQNVQVGNALR